MPTIREIAEACKVSKPTVTAKLKELEMWDGHVNKVGKTFEVDAEASSAVAAALAGSAEKNTTVVFQETPSEDQSGIKEVYEAYVEALKRENDRLWDQIREKDAQIAELQKQLSEASRKRSFWSRLLPSSRD